MGKSPKLIKLIMEERKLNFAGNFQRTLDEKNRMAIPARLRSQLEEAQRKDEVFYLFCHAGSKAIRVYTYDSWLSFIQPKIDALSGDPLRVEKTRAVYRMLDEQRLDGQGRITINKKFASIIGLEKNAEILGSGRYIEITAQVDEKDISSNEEVDLFLYDL